MSKYSKEQYTDLVKQTILKAVDEARLLPPAVWGCRSTPEKAQKFDAESDELASEILAESKLPDLLIALDEKDAEIERLRKANKQLRYALGLHMAMHDDAVFVCGRDDEKRVELALVESVVALKGGA